VQLKDGKREVLDGQQRLRAILEFVQGKFEVDGSIEPKESRLESLDGLFYSKLPRRYKDSFHSFKITVFTLAEYGPAEPGELFFRLNQPASLTAAEKRNAFYGNARDQVKLWVDLLGTTGVDETVLGFSNIRMAYDDTLARVALTVEHGTLTRKITAGELVEVYRTERGFSGATERRIQVIINVFGAGSKFFGTGLHFNKATLYSWFVFLVRASARFDTRGALSILPETFALFLKYFSEQLDSVFKRSTQQKTLWDTNLDQRLLSFYESRATSRVADVSSVLIRDVVAWLYFAEFLRSGLASKGGRIEDALGRELTLVRRIHEELSPLSRVGEDGIEPATEKFKWGLLQ